MFPVGFGKHVQADWKKQRQQQKMKGKIIKSAAINWIIHCDPISFDESRGEKALDSSAEIGYSLCN